MKALFAITLLFTLALAGCSGSGGEGTVPTQDDEGRYVIHLTAGSQFSPKVAKVPVGATVVWVHDGGAPHDVQADDGSFSSGAPGGMGEGDEYEHTFEEAGTFAYHCNLHRSGGMTGRLIVG